MKVRENAEGIAKQRIDHLNSLMAKRIQKEDKISKMKEESFSETKMKNQKGDEKRE